MTEQKTRTRTDHVRDVGPKEWSTADTYATIKHEKKVNEGRRFSECIAALHESGGRTDNHDTFLQLPKALTFFVKQRKVTIALRGKA